MAERIGNPGLGRPTTDEKNAIDEMSEQVAGTNILEWSVLDVHHLLAALGFSQYLGQLQEHDIDGEILVHLDHAALKDIGILSVGQRLAILKAVYKLKLRDDVPFEEGHWIPPMDESEEAQVPGRITGLPPAKVSALLNQRDTRIKSLELEVRRLGDALNSFRDEVHVISKALYTKEPPPDAFQKTGPRSPISNSFTSGSNQPPATSLSRSHSLQHNHASNFFSTSTSHRHGDRLTPSDSPAHSPGPDTIANGPETLADHAAFSTRHGSSHSFSHTFDTGSNPPLTPGGLLGQSPNTPHGSSPSVSKTHPLGSFGTDTLKSSTSSQTETHDVSLQHSHPQASSSSISQPEKASGSGSGGSSSNPYRSFRVTLEDPCYKVLPAALKKYKINDDWRDYALFICYGNGTTERCLSLDEKPLLLFQKLKDSGQNPVFMLRHIKDIKSPIHVASQKHASRREKRAKDKEATLTNSSTLNNVLTSTTSRTAKVYGDGSTGNEDGEGAEKSETPVSASSQSQPLPNPVTAPIKGYCISIYPYMAEREDEFDVAVGDTFVIVTKAKGWWVVFRQSALSAQTVDSDPKTTSSGWVPAGCLLETTLTPTVLAADPTASSVNASRVPIKPVNIVSVSTPGLALMDFKPMGSDELHLIKNEYVRVYKRYNHWSYAIKESTGERGWAPSWFLGRLSKKTTAESSGTLGSPSDSTHP